jgi:hypothetical protein
VASSAGARPVECSTQSNERCSAGRLAPSGFLSQRWGLPPPHPAFRFAWLVLQTARYRGQRSAWQVWAAALTPPLSAALGLSCRRLATAGNKALGRCGLPLPTPPLFAALGLSFRRLATAGNEALGRCGLPPPHPAFRCARLVLQTARYRGQRSAWQVWAAAPTPRFPLRSACLASDSLPRVAKRFLSCARTCVHARPFAAEACNDVTFVALFAASALANRFTVVGGNPPNSPSPLRSASPAVEFCRGKRTRP